MVVRARLKQLVSALFVGLLLLPGFQMLTGALPTAAPLNENRTMAPAPALGQLAAPGAFLAQAQAWFEDHYGLRSLLIRAKTQIDYSLFGVSDKIYIGRQGWLFYRSVIDAEEPLAESQPDAYLAAAAAHIAALRDVLATRGVRLIVMTNQMKDKFYPEYLPATAQRALHRHRFDDFRALLHALPGMTYIDPTDELMRLKQLGPIFHKTDFHWNDPTAAHLAGILVDTIAAQEHRALPFWHAPTRAVTRPFTGGEAQFMPLLFPPTEAALFSERILPSPVDVTLAQYPWETTWRARPGVSGLLPPIVLFGDSFSDGMERSGLYDFFQKGARARVLGAQLADVLKAMPPETRYFVFQFIEQRLVGLTTLKLE